MSLNLGRRYLSQKTFFILWSKNIYRLILSDLKISLFCLHSTLRLIFSRVIHSKNLSIATTCFLPRELFLSNLAQKETLSSSLPKYLTWCSSFSKYFCQTFSWNPAVMNYLGWSLCRKLFLLKFPLCTCFGVDSCTSSRYTQSSPFSTLGSHLRKFHFLLILP